MSQTSSPVTADSTFTLKGTVLASNGDAINAKVFVPIAEASAFSTAYAGADGIFTIAGLIQSGDTYLVTIKVKVGSVYQISFTAPGPGYTFPTPATAGSEPVLAVTFQTTYVQQ